MIKYNKEFKYQKHFADVVAEARQSRVTGTGEQGRGRCCPGGRFKIEWHRASQDEGISRVS